MTCDPGPARQRMQDAIAAAAAAPDAQVAAGALATLFDDTGWLIALARSWMAPMQADPAATPTLPAVRNGPILTATLAEARPVRLMLSLIEGRAERAGSPGTRAPASLCLSGVQSLYRLLSPAPVAATLGTRHGDAFEARTISLRPGEPLSLDERRQALRIVPQEAPVLMLHARIERKPAPPLRRYDLTDGRLLATVQADQGFARSAMLISLLRAAGAQFAVPAMIALLDRPNGAERWTVMRELIALDAVAAWPHLTRMAAHDPDGAVRQAAMAVLARHDPAARAA